MKYRNLERINYSVLENPSEIEAYVLETCKAEWDPVDFDEFGEDLYDQIWELHQVQLDAVQVQQHLLVSEEFVADVTPRIQTQRYIHRRGTPIPPLILRGSDYLIFDGYARWHFMKELGVSECLAYVSVR